MKEINDLIRQYNIKPKKYQKRGKVLVISTDDNKLVIKENKSNIYEYLESRNFKHYPKVINSNNKYQITEYIDEIEMPNEQKILDMIELVSILHKKTTYYREIDSDDYKKIYEDISNNIEHLYNYYNDLITIIESKVYPSPSEQVLENNISKIFSSLYLAKKELDEWLELVSKSEKQRLVLLHNNLDLNHFIKNSSSFLISWDKAKIDIPIFDLYKLYKKYSLKYDFEIIFKKYELIYPLLEEEKKLLFILITLPNKIEFNKSEYLNTVLVTKEIDNIYKTEKLIKEYTKTKEKN